MIKYPYDVVSLVRNKTFAVSAKFGTNEEAEPDTEEAGGSPLSIFASFSRYNFCIIENGVAADANLKLDAIAGLKEKSQWCYQKWMDLQYSGLTPSTKEASESSKEAALLNRPACSVELNGKLKGKTAAQILIEDYDQGKVTLKSHYAWLKSNLPKYKGNKIFMDAIYDSTQLTAEDIELLKELLKNSKNETGTTVSGKYIELVEPVFKPDMKTQNEKGMYKIRSLRVTWNMSKDRNYPVRVEIVNVFAPVVKKPDRTLNVKMSEKDDTTERKSSFDMTADEWINVLEQMELNVKDYRVLNIKGAWRRARNAFFRNREEAVKKKEA